ncbi:survival motor neuron interacting protein 1-domain-containing protein [Haematococcus lacustris]
MNVSIQYGDDEDENSAMDDVSEYGNDEDVRSTEEYNLKMYGIHAALPVGDSDGSDGETDGTSGLPTTAEAYLRLVRAEAAALPQYQAVVVVVVVVVVMVVVVAQVVRVEYISPPSPAAHVHDHLDPEGCRAEALPDQASPQPAALSAAATAGTAAAREHVATAPDWALPSQRWVRQFVLDFSALRSWLHQAADQHAPHLASTPLPHISNTAAWDSQGSSQPGHDQQAEQQAHRVQGQQQTQSGQQQTHEQQQLVKELPHALDGVPGPLLHTVLCLDQVGVAALLQRLVSHSEQSACLAERTAQWLFALAAMLQKPAHSDNIAALRALLRKVSALRSLLGSAADPQLPVLNTLAAVAGAYFGQDPTLVSFVSDLTLP